MRRELKIIFIGLIAVTIFDVLGSIASRQMNFSYSYLGPISFIIYVATAFVIAKRAGKKAAIIGTASVGMYDATVGWKLSIFFHANTGGQKFEITPTILVTTIILVTLYGAIIGFLGWWLSTKISQAK